MRMHPCRPCQVPSLIALCLALDAGIVTAMREGSDSSSVPPMSVNLLLSIPFTSPQGPKAYNCNTLGGYNAITGGPYNLYMGLCESMHSPYTGEDLCLLRQSPGLVSGEYLFFSQATIRTNGAAAAAAACSSAAGVPSQTGLPGLPGLAACRQRGAACAQ